MARPLKVFTIHSANSFPTRAALKAIKAPSHVQQAAVYVVASSKAAVIRQIDEQKFMTRVSSGVIHEATGNSVEALKAAGLLEQEGTVLVEQRRHNHVAARQEDGRFEYIGEIVRKYKRGSYYYSDTFVPATKVTGRITWTTTPEADRKYSYLVAAFGTLGSAVPFTIYRAGNEMGVYTFELHHTLGDPNAEYTGPFTSRKEAEDKAESILAEFLDAAGLTWKDNE